MNGPCNTLTQSRIWVGCSSGSPVHGGFCTDLSACRRHKAIHFRALTQVMPRRCRAVGQCLGLRHRERSNGTRLFPLYHSQRAKRASSNDGMVRPSALAAVKLITSFYLLGACTGRFGSKAKLRPLLQQQTESRLTGRSENVLQHDPPIHFLARCPSCRSPPFLPLRPSCAVAPS